MGWIRVVGALVLVSVAGCSAQPATPTASAPVATAVTTTTSASNTAETPGSLGAAMRRWEMVAGDHFAESARALEEVSRGSDAEDEVAVRSACRRLHDTNAEGLQGHLPTPDPELTAELQRMIDDMNTATHACLRFADGRDPAEATTYQSYLARAVEHLQRAKVILTEALSR